MTGVFAPAVVGLGILLWGAVVHSDSVEALGRRPPQQTKADSTTTGIDERRAPPASPAGEAAGDAGALS
ncbi:MAG TPA: hypothetical protein VGA44_04025 [Steroidobacteraceae bacterium]